MRQLCENGIYVFYQTENAQLLLGDTFELLQKLRPESVDVIFADPPYFLSNNGITCRSGKIVSVNKAAWDMVDDKEHMLANKHQFNRRWINLCKKVLKPNGTIWISGTFHNIFSIGMALEEEGFRIINNITWQKTNPPPNLACRCFTHSTETIIWACKDDKKAKYFFNYALMKEINGGKQMKDVWTGSLTKPSEKKFGKHPTQKPEYLLERILRASTQAGYIVLDPFCGSGTTGVEALRNGCNFIGIDNVEEYLELTQKRLDKEQESLFI